MRAATGATAVNTGLAQMLKAQSMQDELPNVYLGHILVHLGYTYREELEYFHRKPLFKRFMASAALLGESSSV